MLPGESTPIKQFVPLRQTFASYAAESLPDKFWETKVAVLQQFLTETILLRFAERELLEYTVKALRILPGGPFGRGGPVRPRQAFESGDAQCVCGVRVEVEEQRGRVVELGSCADHVTVCWF
jgi:hypothetical protein